MRLHGHNWIAGAERAAVGGAWFELEAPTGAELPLAWPRSDARDLDLAALAASAAESGWRRAGSAARTALLERMAEELLAAPDPGGGAAAALELDAAELAEHVEGLGTALSSAIGHPAALAGSVQLARSPLGARDGPCLIAPSWADTWHAPARMALFALRAGRPVVIASDAELPMCADAIARAASALPPGVLQVLHGDGHALVRAARNERRLASLHVASARAADPEPPQVDGDGLHATSAPSEERLRPRRSTFVVSTAVDPAEQAFAVVEGAIGRACALSGSRSGQIGRVVVPERILSRFTAALLAELESNRSVRAPLARARRAQRDLLEHAFSLGLDEGATALFSGPGQEHRLFPLVFTNVEPRMRISRIASPCALLELVRAPGEGSAHAVATRLAARE